MNKRESWKRKLLGTVLLASLLTACSPAGSIPIREEATATQPAKAADESPEPAIPPPSGGPTESAELPPAQATPLMPAHPGSEEAIDPLMEPLIQMAREDLAERLGVAEDQIEVLEARAVVWPDASLGCPQPGMAYIQIPFDGGLIRLEAGGQEYNYHTGGNDGPFLCEPSGQ